MPLIASHLHFAIGQLSGFQVSEDEHKGFLIGNILPDIRYISGDSRETTHLILKNKHELFSHINATKEESLNPIGRAIKIGVIFHSFVDMWWRRRIYLASKSKFMGMALQIVDEEEALLLLDKKTTLERIKDFKVNSFLNVPGIVIEKWLMLITDYLSQSKFDAKQIIKTILAMKGYESKDKEEILTLVDSVKRNKETLDQIKKIRRSGVPKKIKSDINNIWIS